MSRVLILSIILAGGALTAGCTDNQNLNALTGGLLGAAAGSQVGSGSGRTAATLVGAAAGTAVGYNAPTR
jgi:outer membrane lipoprotein SlyB